MTKLNRLAAACVAITAVASLPEAIAVAAGPACSPPGGQRSASVARAEHADGSSEVTERLDRGAYRVTRCDRKGDLVVSQTVSPIVDPDGAATLVPTEREEPGIHVAMLYGDPTEATWSAAFRRDRAALLADVIPATPAPAPPVDSSSTPAPPAAGVPAPADADPDAADPPSSEDAKPGSDRPDPGMPVPGARPLPSIDDRPSIGSVPTASNGRPPRDGGLAARAAVAGDACSNGEYHAWLTRWTSGVYGYRVNRSRFNYNDTSVASIVDGHQNWDTTRNSCGYADITNLNSNHLGSTSSTIHTYPDGLSIVDRGPMGAIGCSGALACAWTFSSGGSTTETDQRFSESITFSNVGASGAYDYQSVATHETGHSIGLDHANSSSALTMYYQIPAGTTHARSLGRGDVRGLRARYP